MYDTFKVEKTDLCDLFFSGLLFIGQYNILIAIYQSNNCNDS